MRDLKAHRDQAKNHRSEKILKALEGANFDSVVIAPYQIRILGKVDIFHRSGKYHHLAKNRRGVLDLNQNIVSQIFFLLNW